MTRRLAILALAFAALLGAAAPTLDEAKAETDLKKKSKFALRFARKAVDPMVEAFRNGEPEQGRVWLGKIEEGVEISRQALDELDKNPRKSPKHYKRAEIATRKLARELENAKRYLIVEERELVDETLQRIEEINRSLLFAIMQQKKK